MDDHVVRVPVDVNAIARAAARHFDKADDEEFVARAALAVVNVAGSRLYLVILRLVVEALDEPDAA